MWEEFSELRSTLQPLQSRDLEVECIDISGDPVLEERYGTQVPVIEMEGRVLCRYFLDADALRESLSGLPIGV